MVMFITIEVPEERAQELEPYRERLVELLERGNCTAEIDDADSGLGIEGIVGLLASRPTPEQIVAITPSADLQQRVSDLLEGSKAGKLAKNEEAELERYLMLEHLVRLAKSRAYEELSTAE